MNKKILLLSFLCLVFLSAMVNCAFADTTFATLKAYVYFPKVTISHTPIKTISAETRLLKPKISVEFGREGYSSATANVLYYTDKDSTVRTALDDELTIYNNNEFYIALPELAESVSSVHYKIRIIAVNDSGVTTEAYYPDSNVSADEYIEALVASSATAEVNASDGGTVEYSDGNQEYSGTTVTFDPGSVSGSGSVIIEEISLDDLFAAFFPVSGYARSAALKAVKTVATSDIDKNKMLTAYKVYTTGGININTQGYATFSYGSSGSTATKFDVLYSADGSTWEYVKVTSVDTENKTVSCDISNFGYYLIMVSSNLNDSDYRPAKRVRIKSRISNGTYEGFRFGNLVEGDTVKIYNLNGKKIAELTAGDTNGFVWKGRKDTNNSGDWAESGTYVYQIKVKEKGKIISGTIAFVW